MDRHISLVQPGVKGRRLPLEVHARMKTIGLNVMTLTIFINKDSVEAVERQLDALERLIARYGAHAFFGEPDMEPPRQTA
jgi:hypothetical protein